jgi:hypothetical protein
VRAPNESCAQLDQSLNIENIAHALDHGFRCNAVISLISLISLLEEVRQYSFKIPAHGFHRGCALLRIGGVFAYLFGEMSSLRATRRSCWSRS